MRPYGQNSASRSLLHPRFAFQECLCIQESGFFLKTIEFQNNKFQELKQIIQQVLDFDFGMLYLRSQILDLILDYELFYFIQQLMERTNLQDPKFDYSRQLEHKGFMSQAEALRKQREMQTKSVRNVPSASQLHLPSSRTRLTHSRLYRNMEAQGSKKEQGKFMRDQNRAASIKCGRGDIKGIQSNEKGGHEQFSSNLVKLKMEEMVFKFKSRIGTLLKEMNISLIELNRFSALGRIDDILNFLSEKVKDKIINTEITQNNVTKIRSKERQLLSEYQNQIESLKKRILEKQNVERSQKSKLKQNHNQLRELYDRLNLKEKQVSVKMTELYQSKMLLKQNQKLIETLQSKLSLLQKQKNQLRDHTENSHKTITNQTQILTEDNEHLKQENQSLKELLEMAEEKETRLIEFNKNMEQEVARWRERFEEEREKGQGEIKEGKENQGQGILEQKIEQLSNEVKKLNKELQSLQGYKEKYEASIKLSKSIPCTQRLLNQPREQLQLNYAKKMEQISTQWRDKLLEIVDGYAVEEQKRKQEMQKLQQEKKALEIKVYTLANEKYLADCTIIQKETEIYQLTKGLRNKANGNANANAELPSEELLLSSPLIQAQEYTNKGQNLLQSRELSSNNNQYSYKSEI